MSDEKGDSLEVGSYYSVQGVLLLSSGIILKHMGIILGAGD